MSLKISKTANNILKIVGWLAVLIVIVLLAKIYIWERGYYANKTKEARSVAPAVITQVAKAINPSEIKPTDQDVADFQVSADEPRYLTIARLELDKVIITGTSVNNNVLQSPENIYEVAWYSGSARPGTNGYSIITGLADSPSGKAGIFANLDSLEAGDEIQIENGAGEKYTYEVKLINIYDENSIEQGLVAAQQKVDNKETLILVTNIKGDQSAKYNSVAIVRATKKD